MQYYSKLQHCSLEFCSMVSVPFEKSWMHKLQSTRSQLQYCLKYLNFQSRLKKVGKCMHKISAYDVYKPHECCPIDRKSPETHSQCSTGKNPDASFSVQLFHGVNSSKIFRINRIISLNS